MTEDQLWDEHFLLGVKHDRDTVSIVPDFDEVLLGVNGDLDHSHLLVSMVVVGGIDQDLIYRQ